MEDSDTPATVLKYDGEIGIATTRYRAQKRYTIRQLTIQQFVTQLSRCTVTPETYEEYLTLNKSKQDDIKDVGGFVGAILSKGSRRKDNVVNRTLFTFDADYATNGFLKAVHDVLKNYSYTIYSTHKHSDSQPRYRLIVYPNRPMLLDEYQAAARRLSERIGFKYFDHTGLDSNRLMYYPSRAKDGDVHFHHNDNPPINVDEILATYGEGYAWRDAGNWPQSDREATTLSRSLSKQEDPLTKEGVIGGFCRAYSIQVAIDTHLSDVYSKEGGRYSLIGGSSSKGLILYEDKFAYSHHATDRVSGRLYNAYDLVRLHKFGDLDDGASGNSETKSNTAMREFCQKIEPVRKEVIKFQVKMQKDLQNSFDIIDSNEVATSKTTAKEDVNDDWLVKLQTSKEGAIKSTYYNASVIISNDPSLKDIIKFNKLSIRLETHKGKLWADCDTHAVRFFIGEKYGCDFPKPHVNDAITAQGVVNAYHPVQDYLKGLTWDGKYRVRSMFIDYLGCPDTNYAQETSKCWLVAAVNRAFNGGYKFDNTPVFRGEEDLGKSLFIEVLGHPWSGTLETMDSKKSIEELEGLWIVEMDEMTATSKVALEKQKAFLSKTKTILRQAYDKYSTEIRRQCVFAATTNKNEYLIGSTGNRRWWPIDCNDVLVDIKKLRKEKDQIWAEAYTMYLLKETTLLSPEVRVIAKEIQKGKLIADGLEGMLTEWLLRPVDKDRYLRSSTSDEKEQRDRVCVSEILEDCLDERGLSRNYDRKRIASALDLMPHLERKSSVRFGDKYGRQRGWLIKRDQPLFM